VNILSETRGTPAEDGTYSAPCMNMQRLKHPAALFGIGDEKIPTYDRFTASEAGRSHDDTISPSDCAGHGARR